MIGNTSLKEAPVAQYDYAPLRIAPDRVVPLPTRSFEQKVLALYKRIESSTDHKAGCVVAITGMQNRTQGFTYAYELARLASQHLQKRVLVIAAAGGCFADEVLPGDAARGWSHSPDGSSAPRCTIYQLSSPPIAVTQLNTPGDDVARVANQAGLADAIEDFRGAFDLVLLDTPALADGIEAEVLAPFADGLVLVTDAGASRWQAMRKRVEDLSARNITLLGVVLNKRRYYIPKFIYDRL